jgi:hypothetical protein
MEAAQRENSKILMSSQMMDAMPVLDAVAEVVGSDENDRFKRRGWRSVNVSKSARQLRFQAEALAQRERNQNFSPLSAFSTATALSSPTHGARLRERRFAFFMTASMDPDVATDMSPRQNSSPPPLSPRGHVRSGSTSTSQFFTDSVSRYFVLSSPTSSNSAANMGPPMLLGIERSAPTVLSFWFPLASWTPPLQNTRVTLPVVQHPSGPIATLLWLKVARHIARVKRLTFIRKWREWQEARNKFAKEQVLRQTDYISVYFLCFNLIY